MKKGFFSLPQPVLWVILTLAFTFSAIITVYYPVLFNIPINVILPLILVLTFKCVFFERLKLATLIIVRLLILLPVFGLMEPVTFIIIVLVFMAINIMEAGFTDFFKAKQYYNFISAVALALGCYWLRDFSWISSEPGVLSHARYSMGNTLAFFCWTLSYTIWNWIFVTKEFKPSIAFMHIGVLSAPYLGVLIWYLIFKKFDIGYWFALRANSLTFCGIIQVFKKTELEKAFENKKIEKFILKIRKNSVQIPVMIINVILALVPMIVYYS